MRLILATFILLTSFLAHAELIRFVEVSPTLYRSGQPETDEDFAAYRAKGIKTIIDLRWGQAAAAEKERATKLGFRYVNIPLNIESKPADYVAAERAFFMALDNPEAGKVVFHCRHGKDRTGLMAALYRVERDGWSPEEAIEEWKAMGGFDDFWGDSIQDFFKARVRLKRPINCFNLFG